MNTFPELGGFVTSPNIFNKGTQSPDPCGILSECVFGPIVDYKCTCKTLKSRTLDKGKTCVKCGVVCESSKLRLTTLGQIKLLFPIIKPTKIQHIYKLLNKDHKQLLDIEQSDANIVLTRYIIVKNDLKQTKIVTSLNNIPSGYKSVPYRISGIYSLIYVLKYCANVLNVKHIKELFDKQYIIDIVYVIPPDIRPIVAAPNKINELRRVEVNDNYISILNLNKRYNLMSASILDDEKTWNDLVTYNINNGLQHEEIIENMSIEYDRLTALYQRHVNKIYDWAYKALSNKKGLIRNSILGKTIEFSARGVVTINPALKAYEIEVSKKILYKLWMPYFLHWICTIKQNLEYDDAFYNVATEEYEENKELFDEFCEWFTKETYE